jgi:hypothetical protein
MAPLRLRSRSRVIAGAAVGLLLALAVGTPANADPAGPTDYSTEVVAVAPPTPTIRVAVLGGDSFLELRVDPGTEVFVVGYRGEPYLWFRPDGAVLENRRSPSTYINEDRFGGGDVPDSASADAPPEWSPIAANGRWAWHDHRAHWMQPTRPFGQSPGDQILEAVIPLRVDGVDVDVTVISTWQPAPSILPVWFGVAGGVLSAVAAWWARRRNRPLLLVAATPAVVLAVVAGGWQYRSLPAETGPRAVWWILPAVAGVCLVIGLFADVRRRRFAADAALLLVGAELVLWGFVKADGLRASIVPTDAPGWFDRFATSMALAGGAGFVAVSCWALFSRPRAAADRAADGGGDQLVSDSTEPPRSPRPVHP